MDSLGGTTIIVDSSELDSNTLERMLDYIIDSDVLLLGLGKDSILASGCSIGFIQHYISSTSIVRIKIEILAQNIRHDPCIDVELKDRDITLNGLEYYDYLNEFGDPEGLSYEEFLEKYSIIAL